jgi:hypothetical protein
MMKEKIQIGLLRKARTAEHSYAFTLPLCIKGMSDEDGGANAAYRLKRMDPLHGIESLNQDLSALVVTAANTYAATDDAGAIAFANRLRSTKGPSRCRQASGGRLLPA